jgi:hypothetical protein
MKRNRNKRRLWPKKSDEGINGHDMIILSWYCKGTKKSNSLVKEIKVYDVENI